MKILLCLSLFIVLLSGIASAASIQMLPPVQSNDLTLPCTSTGGSKLLSWDGATTIRCQANVVVDDYGRVGIGTTYPSQALDVFGAVRINTNGVGGLITGIDPSTAGWPGKELVFSLADGQGTDNDGIWIGPNVTGAAGGRGWVRLHARNIVMTGNNVAVGIGSPLPPKAKLDVHGGVKIGSDAVCNADKEGTQRYNSSVKQMEFCNGTSWVSMSGGGAAYSTCVWRQHVSGNWSGWTQAVHNEGFGRTCLQGEVMAGISQVVMSTGGIARILCCK